MEATTSANVTSVDVCERSVASSFSRFFVRHLIDNPHQQAKNDAKSHQQHDQVNNALSGDLDVPQLQWIGREHKHGPNRERRRDPKAHHLLSDGGHIHGHVR